MLHIGVRKDFHFTAEEFAIAKGLVRRPFNQSLIRYSDAGVNVDANELRAGGKSDDKCTFCVIAQYVDPKWKIKSAADFQCDRGHERHRMGRYPSGIERHITKVLQNHPIHTAGGERLCVLQHTIPDCIRGEFIHRRSGQRRKVQHSDDGFIFFEYHCLCTLAPILQCEKITEYDNPSSLLLRNWFRYTI